MRYLDERKSKKEWKRFLDLSSVEQLEEERHRIDAEMMRLRDKKKDIQLERDRRMMADPPDPGQVLKVGS